MFVKFRRDMNGPGVSDVHGLLDEKVVPSESAIFETPYVKYAKKPCPPEGMRGPCRIVFEDPATIAQGEYLGEYLEVAIMQDGKPLWLYAASSGSREGYRLAMFVMNDQGKTVDSISCA